MTLVRRLVTRDRLLWFGLAVPVLLEHWAVSGGGTAVAPPWWLTLLVLVALGGAVAVRKHRPSLSLLLVVAVAAAGSIRMLRTDVFPVSYLLALWVLSWLAGRRTDSARHLTLIVVGANLVLLLVGLAWRGDVAVTSAVFTWLFTVLQSFVFVVMPWLLGRHRRQRVLLVEAGWERAERMEAEQRMLLAQARLRERTRIAQDMHDSLGHELSLIALRAGALEVTAGLEERHRAAAGELRVAAATATERLGEIIGVLRGGESAAPLQPADESIGDLVDRAADSGLAIRLVTEGTGEPPAMVHRAAHRVVQEALTNAAKHAPGAQVVVRVHHGSEETSVSVTNGPPQAEPPTSTSGGFGLAGLGERVRSLDGRLHHGATADGGHEVTARLPHEADVSPSSTVDVTDPGSGTEADASAAARSTAASERARARQRVRRGLVTAVGAPLALAAGLGVLILGFYLVAGYGSVLADEDYDRFRVGQERSAIEPELPTFQMLDPPVEKGPATNAGDECEFYRSSNPLSGTYVYRLCFAGGSLTSKDIIQTGSVPVEREETR